MARSFTPVTGVRIPVWNASIQKRGQFFKLPLSRYVFYSSFFLLVRFFGAASSASAGCFFGFLGVASSAAAACFLGSLGAVSSLAAGCFFGSLSAAASFFLVSAQSVFDFLRRF